MKYLKLKFLLMFFALAMAIPPAWAETVTLTASTLGLKGGNSGYQSSEKMIDGIEYVYSDLMMSSDNIQAKATTGEIHNTTAYPGNITSVVITHSGTARVTSILGSSDGSNWSEVATGSGSITGDFSGKGYKYFKITRGGNAAYWTKIEITYEENTPPSTDPVVEITPDPLTIKDNGGTFTVNASHMPNNGLGVVHVQGDPYDTQLPDFSYTLSSNLDYFPLSYSTEKGNYVEGGTININYNGRKLSETGTIGLASGSAKDKATVNYQPDIYIFDDNGGSWNFTTATNKMVYDNGVYTGTVTTTRKNACIMFGRKTGEDYDWNDHGNGGNRLFFGANSSGDWEYGTNTSGSLETNPSDNGHVKYSPIKFPEAGEYIITIDPKAEGGPTFSITSTSVNSIAEGKAFQGNTFKFMGSAVATYQNGQRLWIRDASGSILVYGNVGETFENGDILAPGWTAGYELYIEYIPEFTNPQNVTKAQGTADAAALPLVDNKITTDDVNKYASLSNVTITGVSGNYFYYTVGDDSYQLRNYFSELELDPLEVGRVYNVKGVVSYGNGNPQLWLTDVEDVTPERVKTPTFSPEAGTYYEAKTVSIACETEDATIYYTTNGTDPTTTSEVYRTPINVGQDMTIKAIAVKEGMLNSTIAEAVYIIKDPGDLTQYTKVTNTTDLTNGNYLIVYEDGNLAFDGSRETLDAGQNTFAVDISEGVIYTDVDGFFTYDAAAGTLKSASGYYIGQTSDANGLKSDPDEAYVNAVSIVNGEAVITSGGAYLRYNKTSGQERFRYFKSSPYTAQQPIQLYKEVKTTLPLAVTLPEPPEQHYKVGQTVKVKATVENGSDNTVLTYKVGDVILEADNDGVKLPNKKAGNVELIVTAVDGDNTATDSEIYVFDIADALDITLNPASGSYYYVGDEKNVTVAVEGAIVENPTIKYKFGTDGEEQTYNAETGIVLPTNAAGTINLTVMVYDDGYEHEGADENGISTKTGTYTVNHKPLTITLDPASAEFNVGAEAKVKVTVENAVGESEVEYVASYTVNEEVKTQTLTADTEGYVTLPNDKAVTVTLTVTALDSRPDAEAVEKSGTYKFNAAPAITFTMNTTETNYTVGDEIKVKVADVQNAIGEYDVTYMIGETTLKPDEEGYVTIPSNEAGEVVLTVTVEDLYDHAAEATQTITFNIAAGEAISITLTADPEAEAYTVGEKVNVKVTTTNTIGNDVLITYTTDFESKAEPTYDPEKGIDITSDKAGDVTLTVNVYDGYAHEGADENGITTKTATYKFNAADAIVITFDPASGTAFNVGDDAKVKVTIAGTMGDYEAEYTVNGEETTPEDGYITLPNDKAGEVELAVTVVDGYDHEGEGTATATYIFNNVVVAAPTFTPEPGSYTAGQTVTITCPTEGAVVSYSTDGGNNWTQGNTVTVNEDMTLMAKAVMNGVETTANAVYSFEFPVEPISIEPLEGYYQIKNNGNGKYAYVQGRRTLNFTDAPADKAGTVIYVKTDGHGQVQSLRSQAADLQGYADKAMNYVPELVHLVAQKLETEGVGELFGETGVDAILAKFNESFDHHLYVEPADGGYRIYGKTPSMQPVVEFYRENQAKVDAKLPMLEDAINNAIDKILEKTNGSGASILEHFSLHTIWEKMNDANLIEPTNDASTMAFYHQVLMNKDYVWSFAYETAMIYWTNLKNHPRYENEIKPQLGEFAQYLEKIEQVRPNFKYYIVANGDKPDFISQGNVDITGNAPRTIWSVQPRANFVVNVPEANKVKDGYVTTLYTDFAYTLPEDVTAYKVTAVDENGYATTEAIGNAVPAQTPILLKATAAGDKELTLNPASRAEIEGNLLKGPDYLIGEYQIKNPTVEKMFNLVKTLFGEEIYNRYMLDYEHLMLRYAGLVNNKYFWGLPLDDLMLCMSQVNNEQCVVRSLDVKDGEVAFYDNATVSTNKAFLVTETLDKIMLEKPEVAAPTFTPEPGSYTEAKTVTIGCATEGATILYSTDGGNNWTPGNTVTVDEDMTLMAKAVMNGVETTANAVYSFEFPVEPINIEPLEGYYQIKNNGNGKYAYVQGRRTLNFTDAPADKAGTVIYVKTDDHGQVQSLRSQAADLQGYADKAMNYVPELVHLVAQKLETEGVGELFGETGVDAILAKFDESFDHHLYVEPAEGGYRIYGKTPSMQPVVEFYRENQAKVDAKLPMLEDAINNAIDKILEKTNGSGASILTKFSVDTIWKHMNNPYLIEPVDEASTMAFYHQVLMNKDFVWSFAYETAMIYWTNLKKHPKYETMIKPQLGEFAEYLEKIEQVRPNFKYYIAQKDDKPDFISQGNVDVNQPRNIWTVEPRTDFSVNIAGEMFGCPYAGGLGGYVTSLYTDFAYTLPGDVTAYKVTAVDENGQAELTALEGVVPAQTPVLLIAKEEGDYSLTLSTEAGTPVEGNLLKGPDYLIGEYQIKNPTVEKMFNLVKTLFGEEIYNRYMLDYEHLMLRYAGLMNNKYFWGLPLDDLMLCMSQVNNEQCVVRSLDVKDGEVAFYDNATVSTNKAFLVTETLDKITLDGLRGDVNHDGKITIKDVTDLIDRLLGDESHSCPYCSDVNSNNDVDIKDVTDLIDILLNSGADTHVDTPTPDPEGGE